MLICLANLELIEYPDELGALVLAESIAPTDPPIPLDEVNLLVNGVLGLLYDENLSLEENIQHAREHCTRRGMPTAEKLQKGFEQIKEYNENVPTFDKCSITIDLNKNLRFSL